MQKRLFFWEVAGFLFTSALGTVLHFVYEWSGGALAAAFVSAVNESTWEHMKLLFVPMLLFSAVQVWVQREPRPNFWAVRALSTAAGLVLIPVLYLHRCVGSDAALGQHRRVLPGGPGGLLAGFLPAAAQLPRCPLAAGGGRGRAGGAGAVLRLVHLFPAPHRPVAGPHYRQLRNLKQRRDGKVSPLFISILQLSYLDRPSPAGV